MKTLNLVIEDDDNCHESCEALIKTIKGYICNIFDDEKLEFYEDDYTPSVTVKRCQTCKERI